MPTQQELLAKCEDVLALLYANQDHPKLRRLIGDIEAMRDKLVAESDPTHEPGALLNSEDL
jgi:hypothetical protein